MLFHTPELQKSLSSSQDYEDQVNQLVDLLYLMQADPPQIKGRAYYNLREIISKARSLTALLRCQRVAVYEVDTSIKVGDAYDNTTMTDIRPLADSDDGGSDGSGDDAAGGDGGDGGDSSDGGNDDAAGGDGGDGSRRPRCRKKEVLVAGVIANAIVKRPAPKSPQVHAYLSKARVTVLSPE